MSNVWTASDGDLVRSAAPYRVVRTQYRYHFARIDNTHQLRATLRAGSHTSVGGYPLYFVTSDGAALCFDCARSEYRNVRDSIKSNCSDGWKIVATDVNYEDAELSCDHCAKDIAPAYGE